MSYRIFLFFLLTLPVTDTQGQSSSLLQFIDCIEQQHGTNNLLVNGRPYLPTKPLANPHPYFQTKEWKPGFVYLNGNPYPAKQLKYNLSNAQLIIKHKRPNGTSQKVILSNLLIDSFRIGQHVFVNWSLILPEINQSGYLEEIFIDKLSFYRLQKKVFNVAHNKERPHGWFSLQKDVFYLLLDSRTFKITNKNQFLACFPNHHKQIKKYLKDHALRWRKMSKNQFSQFLKFCNDQL